MSTTSLTPDQVRQIRRAIEDAREGRATLAELGAAHDLCQGAKPPLPGCAAELRAHIRELAKDRHEPRDSVARDVFTGVVSGIVTTAILGGL